MTGLGQTAVALTLAGRVLSPADEMLLSQTWAAYRSAFMQPDGRVIDHGAADRSTSEGQSYALVRALVMDDEATFEQVRTWTLKNLQHDDPTRLPAWAWGRMASGEWGISDPMPASDADEWMAWALIGAAHRWHRPEYKEQALGLLAGVWNEETQEVAGRRILLPGPWAKGKNPVRVNPSYWLPFTWRVFAQEDKEHDWASLIDPAYELLDTCRGDARLPPDWCYLDAADGAVLAPPKGSEKDADFGFEAFRVAWTLAAELKWSADPRARFLLHDFARLADRWRADGSLPAVIAPDGKARVDYSYQGLYGAMLPAWSLVRRGRAEALWQAAIVPTRAAHGWGDPVDYYGQNWIWLGYALWHGAMGPQGPA